jgi:hypothetical protein
VESERVAIGQRHQRLRIAGTCGVAFMGCSQEVTQIAILDLLIHVDRQRGIIIIDSSKQWWGFIRGDINTTSGHLRTIDGRWRTRCASDSSSGTSTLNTMPGAKVIEPISGCDDYVTIKTGAINTPNTLMTHYRVGLDNSVSIPKWHAGH